MLTVRSCPCNKNKWYLSAQNSETSIEDMDPCKRPESLWISSWQPKIAKNSCDGKWTAEKVNNNTSGEFGANF